jgi:hypothetical protein
LGCRVERFGSLLELAVAPELFRCALGSFCGGQACVARSFAFGGWIR